MLKFMHEAGAMPKIIRRVLKLMNKDLVITADDIHNEIRAIGGIVRESIEVTNSSKRLFYLKLTLDFY